MSVPCRNFEMPKTWKKKSEIKSSATRCPSIHPYSSCLLVNSFPLKSFIYFYCVSFFVFMHLFLILHSPPLNSTTRQLDNSTHLTPLATSAWSQGLVQNIRWESQLQGRTRRANLVAWNFWTFQKSMCLSHLEHQPESSGTWVLNIEDDATFTHVSQQDSRNTCVFCFVTQQLKFEVHIGCFSSRLRFDPHSFLCTQERSKSCA